jgi:hypothetical protein
METCSDGIKKFSNGRSLMPRLTERAFFGGSEEKLNRLGLTSVWKELESILTNFQLCLDGRDKTNSGIVLRKLIDARFRSTGGWRGKRSSGVNWTRCHKTRDVHVCLGTQVQLSVSAESDLILVDLQFLEDEIAGGRIDVGAIVVPSDKLACFLSDGVVRYSDAVRGIKRTQASDLPLAVLALEHDSVGPLLTKSQARQEKKRIVKNEASAKPVISDPSERWLGV